MRPVEPWFQPRPRRRAALMALLFGGAGFHRYLPAADAAATYTDRRMKLQLRLGDQTLDILMDDNPTARDLVSLLPLTLDLEDFAATEKIAYLPRRLSTAEAPDGYTPAAGDLAYYAPWGNLAIFHKDFRYAARLIRLGRIEGGIERLATPGRRAAQLVLVAP